MFLSSNNTTPCFGDTVDFICYYPDVMERVNGQPRYLATSASYRVNGNHIFQDKSLFDQRLINQTTSRLRVRIDPANFSGDHVSFTCYLPLTGGGEDSSSIVVHLQRLGTYIHTCNNLVLSCIRSEAFIEHWLTSQVPM